MWVPDFPGPLYREQWGTLPPLHHQSALSRSPFSLQLSGGNLMLGQPEGRLQMPRTPEGASSLPTVAPAVNMEGRLVLTSSPEGQS